MSPHKSPEISQSFIHYFYKHFEIDNKLTMIVVRVNDVNGRTGKILNVAFLRWLDASTKLFIVHPLHRQPVESLVSAGANVAVETRLEIEKGFYA